MFVNFHWVGNIIGAASQLLVTLMIEDPEKLKNGVGVEMFNEMKSLICEDPEELKGGMGKVMFDVIDSVGDIE